MHACIKKSNIRVIVVFSILVVYLFFGSLIFTVIEHPWEENRVKDLQNTVNNFRENNKCIQDVELEEFIREIIRANNRGVSALKNVTNEPNWSFGQSFFFAGTILTTIGYGHVTPLSDGGKAFCIIYAIIGIPVTLILITAIIERMLMLVKKLQEWLRDRLSGVYESFTIRIAHLSIIVLVILIFMFLIPSAILTSLEPNWSYFDAFYYCFISLTTIGLGDYIPGDHRDQKNRPIYKVATTFYLFIGLTFMMLLITVIYQNPELNVGYYLSLKSDSDAEDKQERIRLRTLPSSGPNYVQQVDEVSPENVNTSVPSGSGSVPNGKTVQQEY